MVTVVMEVGVCGDGCGCVVIAVNRLWWIICSVPKWVFFLEPLQTFPKISSLFCLKVSIDTH